MNYKIVILVYFFTFASIFADTNNKSTDLIPTISSCEVYVELFANAASNLTSCIVRNSRPFSVCKSCLGQYLECQETFDILMKTTSADPNESCAEKVAHMDHVQMIGKVHNFVKDSWDSNYCNSCYDSLESGIFSNRTKEFLERLATFDKCIFDSLGNHLPYIIPGNLSVNRTICTRCLSSYKNLTDFYSTLDPNFNGHFCMDLSDSMNFTWKVWHEDFECSVRYKSIDVCVGTSLFIAIFPVVFYFIAKVCSSDITKIFIRGGLDHDHHEGRDGRLMRKPFPNHVDFSAFYSVLNHSKTTQHVLFKLFSLCN